MKIKLIKKTEQNKEDFGCWFFDLSFKGRIINAVEDPINSNLWRTVANKQRDYPFNSSWYIPKNLAIVMK